MSQWQFSVTIRNVVFKSIISVLSTLFKDTNFEFNNYSWNLSTIDPSQICLVELHITQQIFELYACENPIVNELNVEISEKMIRKFGKNEMITLQFDKDTLNIKAKLNKNTKY